MGGVAHSAIRNPVGRIGLLLFGVLAVLPIVFSIGYAGAYSTGLAGLLSDGITWAYWARVIRSAEIWTSFGLSLYIAGVTVLLTVAIALPLSLYLGRQLSRGPLSYAIYLPLAIPATVAAFFVFQLLAGAGYLSRVALHLGWISEIGQFPELINDAAGVGIIVTHTGLAAPFFMLLFHEIYRSERVEALAQLASTLGATSTQLLVRVKIPMLLRQSMTNIILFFIAVLGSYEIPLLLGRQAPQMVSVLTLRKYQLFNIEEKPEAFIIAIVYTVLVLGLITIVFRRESKHNG